MGYGDLLDTKGGSWLGGRAWIHRTSKRDRPEGLYLGDGE